jgi:hypothetical protein
VEVCFLRSAGGHPIVGCPVTHIVLPEKEKEKDMVEDSGTLTSSVSV